MTQTFLFGTEKGNRFIINDERSKLGYGYPRIFVETSNGDFNFDTTLGGCFKMKPGDFESWLDGTEITTSLEEAVKSAWGVSDESQIDRITESVKALVEDLQKGGEDGKQRPKRE